MHNHLLEYLPLENFYIANCMIERARLVVFGLKDIETGHGSSVSFVRIVEPEIKIEDLFSDISIVEFKFEPHLPPITILQVKCHHRVVNRCVPLAYLLILLNIEPLKVHSLRSLR